MRNVEGKSGQERDRQLGWEQHQTNTGNTSSGETLEGDRKGTRERAAQGRREVEKEPPSDEATGGL